MDEAGLLNDAERRLWKAFSLGERVNLGEGSPADPQFEVAGWSDKRSVRAEVITRLLLGVRQPEPGYTAKIDLAGARITGALDLELGELRHDLLLRRCWLDRAPNLNLATTRSIVFAACRLPGLTATSSQINGQVSLQQSRFQGEVNFDSARVQGPFLCDGAQLVNPGATALSLANAEIGQGVVLGSRFAATGGLYLSGAHIGGDLILSGASLSNPDGDALLADGLVLGMSLYGDEGFTSHGEMQLIGAQINGVVTFEGATLTNPGGTAMCFENATIEQSFFCRDGFTAAGAVELRGAHIKGQLNLRDATITNPGSLALSADNVVIDQNMFCDTSFRATGLVDLSAAKIGGFVSFVGANLSDGHPDDVVLSLHHTEAKAVRLGQGIAGVIDLRHARIGVLDLPGVKQPPPTMLSGLTYVDLDPDPDPDVRDRITWLSRDPSGFHPQPYEQLAAYYRGVGHDYEARKVLLSKRRRHRRANQGVGRLFGLLLDALAGYGYVPLRAFCWLIAAVAAGALVFRGMPMTNPPTGSRDVNALLLALDSIIPTSPFGLRVSADPNGWAFGVATALQILGYALALAVLPAVSRALSRADK